MKTVTIDETCGQPEGSFNKFVEKEEARIQALEDERKRRIRGARAAKHKTKP